VQLLPDAGANASVAKRLASQGQSEACRQCAKQQSHWKHGVRCGAARTFSITSFVPARLRKITAWNFAGEEARPGDQSADCGAFRGSGDIARSSPRAGKLECMINAANHNGLHICPDRHCSPTTAPVYCELEPVPWLV
jgi:hypothetical protein